MAVGLDNTVGYSLAVQEMTALLASKIPVGEAIAVLVQVSAWKTEVVQRLPEVFAGKPDADAAAAKEREKDPYEEIGRLKIELGWLKKSWPARALRNAAT